MEDGFLSIKEFAKLAGVTPQAIYKQLNNHSTKVDNQLNNHSTKVDNQLNNHSTKVDNQLNNHSTKVDNQLIAYVKFVDGRKVIDIKALRLFNVAEVDNRLNNSHSTEVDNQLNNHSTKVDNQKEDVLAIFEEQLHIKDKQIETLQSDLAETRNQLSKIADQAQQLQLAQMKLLPNKEEQMLEREKKQKPNYWKGVSIGLMAIVAAGAAVFILLLNGIL